MITSWTLKLMIQEYMVEDNILFDDIYYFSGLKFSVILPTYALNYCAQKWKKCIKIKEALLVWTDGLQV